MNFNHNKTTARLKSELFNVSVMVFVATSAIAYALVKVICPSFIEVYPDKAIIDGTIGGEIFGETFWRLLTAIVLGVIGVLIYLAIGYLARRFHLLHVDHMIVVTSTTVWTAVALIIYQERYHFMPTENLHSEAIFSQNFWILFVILLVLFFGLLFNSGFEHRIARQVKRQPDYKDTNETEI